jgi:hypothetical protein
MRSPTEQEIDAGAKALRERQMAGRITQPWHVLPNSAKRKWRDHASVVLCAALSVETPK